MYKPQKVDYVVRHIGALNPYAFILPEIGTISNSRDVQNMSSLFCIVMNERYIDLALFHVRV